VIRENSVIIKRNKEREKADWPLRFAGRNGRLKGGTFYSPEKGGGRVRGGLKGGRNPGSLVISAWKGKVSSPRTEKRS